MRGALFEALIGMGVVRLSDIKAPNSISFVFSVEPSPESVFNDAT